jgi:uncharacterized integral membrane protein
MSETQKDSARTGRKPWQRITPKEIVGIVIAVIAVIFIAENGRKTQIRFVGPQVTTYLWLALLVAAVLGFVAGLLVARQRSRS